MTDQAIASSEGAQSAAPTVTDLGNLFAEARTTEIPAEREEPEQAATAEPELAREANAAPVEEQATGETKEADPAAKPPLELPRSWTKDRAEHWAKLDPDTQEFLLEQDRKASAEVRRVQNDAAEKLKSLTAKEQLAEERKQQYEAQLPALMQTLQDAQQAAFGDIKTVADVERMQAEDPFRFQAWQVQQMKLQAAHAESERVKSQQTQKQQTDWNQHVQKENELAAEKIPELADKEKAPAFYKRAVDRLKELEFTQEEINDLATGKEKLSIHDHRLQLLLASDFKLADIQKAKVAVVAKTLPPAPQRPGTSKPPNSATSETITNLSAKLERTGEIRDLGNLIGALRRA